MFVECNLELLPELCHCQIIDDFERNEAERRKFLNSARLKKVDRFLTQSGMRKEQVGIDTIEKQNKQQSF